MSWNVRVLEDKQIYHIFVDLRVLEYSAVSSELPLVYKNNLVVGVRLQKLIQIRVQNNLLCKSKFNCHA